MKTTTKTFYVGINDLHNLKHPIYFLTPEIAHEKTPEHEFEIQISWQEPEKKIEITESEFDEAFKHFGDTKSFNECKQKLFGNIEG